MEFNSILSSIQATDLDTNSLNLNTDQKPTADEELVPPPAPPSSPELQVTTNSNHEAYDDYDNEDDHVDIENPAKVSGWLTAIGVLTTPATDTPSPPPARARSCTLTQHDTLSPHRTPPTHDVILSGETMSQTPTHSAEISPTLARFTNDDRNINAPDIQFADTPVNQPYLVNSVSDGRTAQHVSSPNGPVRAFWACYWCRQIKEYPVPQPNNYKFSCDKCGSRVFLKPVVQDPTKRPRFLAR
jgi:hypothetical protein